MTNYAGMSAEQIATDLARNGYTQEGIDALYTARGLGQAPRVPPELIGGRPGAGRDSIHIYGADGKLIRSGGSRDFLNSFYRQAIDPFRPTTVGNYLGMAGLLAGGIGAGAAIAGGAGVGAAGGASAAGGGTAAGTGSGLGIFGAGGTGGLAGVGGGSAGALASAGGIAGGAGIGGTTAGALGGLSGIANSISGVGGGAAGAGGGSMGWLDTVIDIAPDVIGAVLGHDAAGDAADIQQRASREAIAETRRQYDQNRADLTPYREAGTTALGQIGTGLAEGGDFNRDFTIADFQKDPGYEFRLGEGRRALEGSAAAGSGLFNGGVGRRLERYGQDYATGEFSNAYNRFNNDRTTRFNRLASIAGVGQTATNTGVNAGINSSRDVTDSIIGGANAAAAGRVGQANAVTGGLESLGDYYRNRRYGGTQQPYGGIPLGRNGL